MQNLKPQFAYLRDSEMANRVKEFDWSSTTLGPISTWPESLKTAAGICLNSKFPMHIWWGEDLICLYNDAYIQIIGSMHPESLGLPAKKIWPDIWDVIEPEKFN